MRIPAKKTSRMLPLNRLTALILCVLLLSAHVLGASAFATDPLDQAGEVVRITGLRSSNAGAYATNRKNTSLLQITGDYSIIADTTGTPITVVLENTDGQYFSEPSASPESGHIQLPPTADNLQISRDGAKVIVTFDVYGHQGSAGSFTINFPYDHATYDGWVARGTSLAVVNAQAEGMADTAVISVVSTTSDDRSMSFVKTPVEDIPLGKDAGIALHLTDEKNSDLITPTWRNVPGSIMTLTLEYPAGAVVTGYQPTSGGLVGVDDHNGKITYTFDAAGADGAIRTGWTLLDAATATRSLHLDNIRIGFPDTAFTIGQQITLKAYATYTLSGQTTTTDLGKELTFKLTDNNVHLKPGALSVGDFDTCVSIGVPKRSSSQVSYGNISNAGGLPVPNTRFTWYNDVTAKKALPATILITNKGITCKNQLVFTIKSATGEADRGEVVVYLNAAASSGKNVTYSISSLGLKQGEYIERVDIYPLDNPNNTVAQLNAGTATPVRALPYGAEVVYSFYMRSWEGGYFPDGTTKIEHNDKSVTRVSLSWDDESQPETHSGAVASGNTLTVTKANTSTRQNVYYGLNAPRPTTFFAWPANQSGTMAPGAEVTAEIKFYNSIYSGADEWVDPVMLMLLPDFVTFDPDQTLTVYKNATPVGSATVTEKIVDGKTVYVITTSKMNVPISMGYASDTYSIPVQLTIKPGTPAGSYYLARTDGKNYPATSGLIFGTSREPNNLIYTIVPPNYFVDTKDYDENALTTHLVFPNATTTVNVAQLQEMQVTSLLFNNLVGNNGTWQNVNVPGSEATLEPGGTGHIKLQMTNVGNTYLGNITILDILPDTSDMLSKWDAYLSNLQVAVLNENGVDVTKSEGFDTAYTLQYSLKRDPSYNGGGIVRTGADGMFAADAVLTTARSFLLEMNGKRLAPGYSIVLTALVLAPKPIRSEHIGQSAYNTFTANAVFYNGTTGTTGACMATAFTPQKQKFTLYDTATAQLTPCGIVYRDLDWSDSYSAFDQLAEGADVWLLSEDTENPGKPDTDSPFRTTKTDAQGKYSFANLPAGNYWIYVAKNVGEAYGYGAKGSAKDGLASHVDPATGISDMITLMVGECRPAPVNAALNVTLKVTVRFYEENLDGALLNTETSTVRMTEYLPVTGSVSGNSFRHVPALARYRLVPGSVDSYNYSLSWEKPEDEFNFFLTSDGEDNTDPGALTYTARFFNNYAPLSEYDALRQSGLKAGDKLSVPANPVRSGYTFLGWYTQAGDHAAAGNARWDFATGTISGNLELYAAWKRSGGDSPEPPSGTDPQTPAEPPVVIDGGTTPGSGPQDDDGDDLPDGKPPLADPGLPATGSTVWSDLWALFAGISLLLGAAALYGSRKSKKQQ